jgi:hypothetical protein
LGGGLAHVPASQRDRVEPQLVGCQIDQPLDDEDRLGRPAVVETVLVTAPRPRK